MNYMPDSAHARDVASLIHPQTNLRTHEEIGPTIFARGQGVRVFDDSGKDYVEAASGLWCASLGFASERLAKVAYEQMRTLGYYQTFRHASNEAAIDLADRLKALAPVPMARVAFQCSGSEANDLAVKLIWYYHHAIGKPEKRKIIARLRGYHGTTVTTTGLSGRPDMHADFGLPVGPFLHTEFPHWYRFHEEGESEEAFASRMAEALEKLILDEGPDTVAAFFAEPVMGAGGAILPPATYFEKVQAVLKKYDVLFVADEVICGFGRTGSMWGCQTYDLRPDMISCAKALSAAMQPISALLVNDKVWSAMAAESDKLGNFSHGTTYAGHPVAAAVALEVLKIYEEIDVVARVREVSPVLLDGFARLLDHPLVGDARGVGLVGGLEVVRDKATREPYAASAEVGGRIGRHARAAGVIPRIVGDRVVFAPPLIVSASEVEEMLARVGKALDATLAELTAEGLAPA